MGINKVSGFKNTLPTRKLSEGLNSNKNREEIIGRRNDAYSLLSSVAQPLLNLGSLLQFSLLLACLFSFMSTVSGDGSGDYQAIVNPTKCGFPDPESVFNGTQPCYDMHTANFSSTNASLTCADWGIVIPCVRNYNISLPVCFHEITTSKDDYNYAPETDLSNYNEDCISDGLSNIACALLASVNSRK